MNEGVRLAREAALGLLAEIDQGETQTSVDDAMEYYKLEQHIVPQQLELPFEAPPDVRGILDAAGMSVYVREVRSARVRWVASHEIGHYAITEHNEILRFCNSWDLSPSARKQLEVEANAFAADFLFQGKRFIQECLSRDFSIEMLRTLSAMFGVSSEAGFRRFVEEHPEPVALLVSRPQKTTVVGDGQIVGFGVARTRLRYGSYSRQFLRGYGIAEVGQVFAEDHPISLATGGEDTTGTLVFRGQRLQVASFFNQYDVLSIVRRGRP